MPNNDSHQHVVKTSEQWNDRIVEFWVVPRGCLCVELTPKGKTKIKIGEGNKYYSQLPYICDGHDLSQYYTKDEIDNLFDNLNRMAIMSTDEYDAKSDLPMNDNKLGDVRFVKSSSPSIKSDPDIYLWDGSKWVFVGYEFKDIDLSQYLKKDEFHEMFDPVKEQVDEMYPMRHTHENKDILDQITAPYTIPEKEKLAGLENYDDTEIRQLIHDTGHTHPNKDILDTITSESLWSESDREKFDSLHNYDDSEVKVRIETLESKSHTHDNKDILDQITAPFTTEDKTKLDSLHNDDVFRGTDGMYPGSEGNVPAPSVLDVGKFLSSDGTWKSAGSDVDFIGATSTTDGYHGLVPAPMAGEETYFLKGDGTWARIKQGGDKYKAGEGIYILSGEVTSDTFPFEIYSRSQKIKQYIIYGNINGVGNLVDGKYQIPIRVSAQGYTDRISIITIDDPLYEGDYIDFQKQVFAHYKTNITSQITNPSTDTRATGINSNGEFYWKSSFNGWGGAPRVTDYIEIEEGANYEITHTYPSNDFTDALNVNVYDANKNRTRTIITSRDSSTLFSPASNEKYFRYSYCAEGDGYSNVLRLKPVETPCILQEIILYPNAINTVNIDATTKPNEVYFEVEEPEEIDPDDPMAQFSGIIYNDGVLDITQEDPDNLNILTIHFRDDVTKDITIDTGVDNCVVDITQEDPDNLNTLTITYADGTTTTITVPTGDSTYNAGDGISFEFGKSETSEEIFIGHESDWRNWTYYSSTSSGGTNWPQTISNTANEGRKYLDILGRKIKIEAYDINDRALWTFLYFYNSNKTHYDSSPTAKKTGTEDNIHDIPDSVAYIGIAVERLPDSDTSHSTSRRENIPVSELKNVKITWITEDDDEVYINNEGVLDVTQDDPDNLNILTIHFRNDVTKDLTIDAGVDECVVDITQEDPDNLNTLTIIYADGSTTTITIPDENDVYYPGQGIEFTHPESELYRVVEYIKKPKGVSVVTDVIPSGTTDFRCDMKYFSYIGRFTILAHNGERGSFCFSPPATNQSVATRMWMYSAHEVWEDLYLYSSSYSADPVIAHLQWGYTMSIAYDHISDTARKTTDILPGTNNVTFNSECDTSYYWAKFYENDILVGDLVPVIRDSDNAYGFFNKITNVFSAADGAMSGGAETGEVIEIGDTSEKHITAKLGIGLTFDANDAIELDDTIKIKLNCNNEPD